ncbi:unnamed protein product [Clonostachys rosea f. rosea IK726]|jgi:glutathione S-transferase|uniref:Uncharacterized protein n=1 Tax=Clonostachys rosea f. rosea IK726 TaxID=1349383 RepID=A0ACA9T5R2_BIOOC|nr:unnamed protein product [Clonostachys rosea f. rosea IK726]
MSTANMDLYVLPATYYPRRVLIYLYEKGLINSAHINVIPVEISQTGQMAAPGKPPGSVPILRLPDGTLIKQSLAILEYFEDICDHPKDQWQKDLFKGTNCNSMRGATAEARARIREIMGLADEASSQFGFACHKGSKLFVPIEETNADAGRLAMEYCRKTLSTIEKYYEEDDRLQSEVFPEMNIADCVLFALLEFASGVYGVDFFANGQLPNLQRFSQMVGKRGSARIPEEAWKQIEGVRIMGRQWLF